MPIVAHEVVGFGNFRFPFFAVIIPSIWGFLCFFFWSVLLLLFFFLILLFMICSFHGPSSCDGTVAETIVSSHWTLSKPLRLLSVYSYFSNKWKKQMKKAKEKLLKKISILFRVGIEFVYFVETNFFLLKVL